MIPLQSLILMLLMILAPFILYALFFLIKCTPNPLSLLRRGGSPGGEDPDHREAIKAGEEEEDEKNSSNMEMIKAVGSNMGKDTECPVCLSVFKEGEELKQIKICKHFFHQSCIDTWLSSHFNCPVCRAFVSNKRRSKGKEERENQRRGRVLGRDLHRDDLWQGLPDSTGLV